MRPGTGNDWRKGGVIPRVHHSCPLVMLSLHGSGNNGVSRFQGTRVASRSVYTGTFVQPCSVLNVEDYHLTKKDGILTKSVWARKFRIFNVMGLPMKIRQARLLNMLCSRRFQVVRLRNSPSQGHWSPCAPMLYCVVPGHRLVTFDFTCGHMCSHSKILLTCSTISESI